MNVVAQKALDKAKIQLMSRPESVFFTVVCFSLVHEWDSTIPTACTNGKYIKFNPDFFMSLNQQEQVFLLLHETLHVAFMHVLRLHTYNPLRWNYAADYVINHLLIEQGFKMPQGGLHDPKYADMSVKQVYDLLEDEVDEDEESSFGVFGVDLQPAEGDSNNAAASEKAEQEIAEILVRASTQAAMAGQDVGNIPGDILLYLDGLLNPKLPWGTILKRYVSKLTKSDYSMRRPNRRFFPKHYLPSMFSTALCDIAVAVDTSGSVSDADFKQFVSEVDSIIRVQKPTNLTFIQFDYGIKSVDVVKNSKELMNLSFTGRGGTCIEPVMEWAQENKPHLLIVFTDGYFRQERVPVDSNVIWVIHNNKNFTGYIGKTIHYEV